MSPQQWRSNAVALYKEAQQGWQQLCSIYRSLGATLEFIPPAPQLPDMVFVANAAIVFNQKCLLASFKFKERQGETAHYERFFLELQERGLIQDIQHFPEEISQEGAGDCLWDAHHQWFWCGYGPRSTQASVEFIAHYFEKPAVGLELAGPFYHIDLCLSPLPGGKLMFCPEAFTPAACQKIEALVAPESLIRITYQDAQLFGLNAFALGTDVVLPTGLSQPLHTQLTDLGYAIHEAPVTPFGLAGGACRCLTLQLDLGD